MFSQKMSFRDFLNDSFVAKKPIFLDGGMGTMIQKLSQGSLQYEIPEDLNFYKPDLIKQIHLSYLKAGANVLTANSFGANKIKLGENASHSAEEYIERAIFLEKEAVLEAERDGFCAPHYISWDSGQVGKLLEPMGTLTFDEAYDAYKSAAIAAERAGAQLAIIETMSDLYEVKAAVLAIRENTSLPIIATMTFQSNLRTLTGADVLTCVTYLEALRVDALGFNCGGSIEEDSKLAEQFLSFAHIPVCVQPNAGLPQVIDGKDVYVVTPDEFAFSQLQNRLLGTTILGGCCGTTPEHICAMKNKIVQECETLFEKNKTCTEKNATWNNTYICSYNKTLQIGKTAGPVLIGERINPTGKKKCKEALLNNNFQYIVDEADSQIKQGANVLDVNVGLPEIDETEAMCKAIKEIQTVFNIPLQLDSSEPCVLEKALRYYNGKALVNSVNGKQKTMDAVFPLIAKYGGAIVALCIDESGIAAKAEGRVLVAKKMIAEAKKYNIPVRDIFIDTLTLTVSSEQENALETIKAIRILKEEFGSEGLQFVLGVSNISFGLPRRDILNSRFFTLALEAGLSGCIINPASNAMMDSFRAFRALSGFDKNSLDYIQTYMGSLDPASKKAKDEILLNALKDGTLSISVNLSGGESVSQVAKNVNLFADKNGVSKKSPSGSFANSSDSFSDSQKVQNAGAESELIKIIENGFKDKAALCTEKLLETFAPVDIIEKAIVPALDSVGKDYESGKKFLPQLLLSAETVSESFSRIKAKLSESGQNAESKGSIVLATVYGDIHDIGKNIVRALLENYGYTVLDLGKNVPPEKIISTVLENKIQLVGLSALMTTTVANMEQTIKQLKAALLLNNLNCKIVVGGAVLTADYAKKIGADYYARDAMETVMVAKEVFGK